MQQIKKEYGCRCFYFPAKSEEFWELQLGLSSGQQKILGLEKIFANLENYDLVLLDEWNGTLDAVNKDKADKMIFQMAQRVLLIETRH